MTGSGLRCASELTNGSTRSYAIAGKTMGTSPRPFGHQSLVSDEIPRRGISANGESIAGVRNRAHGVGERRERLTASL